MEIKMEVMSNFIAFDPLSASVALIKKPVNWLLCKSIDWFLYEDNTGT